MPDIANTVYDKMLDALLGQASYTAETPHIALFNGDPQSGGTEVTSDIRAAGRIAATAMFSASANGTSSNTSTIDFGNAAGAATVTHLALMDAANAGNVLAGDGIAGGTQTITAGNPVAVAVGALTVSLSG